MDNSIVKKRLNTFKSAKGTLKHVSDDVVVEVLRAWENWPGQSSDLYRELGLSKMQMVTLIKKAKNLVKSGVVTESEFKEIAVNTHPEAFIKNHEFNVELTWDNSKVIRFAHVEQLVDFLKKVA